MGWDLVIWCQETIPVVTKNDSLWLACPAKGIFRCEAKLAVPWGLPPLFLSILTQLTPALPHQQWCNTTSSFFPKSRLLRTLVLYTSTFPLTHSQLHEFKISWSCQTNCTICEIFQCGTFFAELQVEAKSAAKKHVKVTIYISISKEWRKQNVEQNQIHREKARKCMLMLFVL